MLLAEMANIQGGGGFESKDREFGQTSRNVRQAVGPAGLNDKRQF